MGQRLTVGTPVSLSVPGICPPRGTARAVKIQSLLLGNTPNIVYIVNEGIYGNTPDSSLRRYDVKTDSKTDIVRLSNAIITEAQVSSDGQWILFITQKSGWSLLQVIRMDGQYMRTLYCASPTETISHTLWSIDQKWVMFDDIRDLGVKTLYLLNINNGVIQPELSSSRDCLFYSPFSWLNKTQVYLLFGLFDCVPTGPPTTTTVVLLDITNGSNQSENNLHSILEISDVNSLASRPGSGDLFISEASDGGNTGISTIRMIGGRTAYSGFIYTSSVNIVEEIRVISSTTLLLSTLRSINNTLQRELWKMNTDGSNLKLLTDINTIDGPRLNYFTQDTWSNASRDGSMYAIQGKNQDYQNALFYGFMKGGPPITFDTTSDESDLAIVGWTTM